MAFRWTPIICLPLLFVITSCAKEASALANGIAADPNGGPTYGLQAIGTHQLVLSPSTDSTSAIVILDWVDMQAPEVNFPRPIDRYELQNDGRDLVLIGGGVPLARFSTRNDPTGMKGEALYHVNGISRLTDPVGFNMGLLKNSSEDDAFRAINSARLSRPGSERTDGGGGPGKTPSRDCHSGGPGSTSCSTHGQTYSCTVTCGSGYYACCDMSGIECTCIKE